MQNLHNTVFKSLCHLVGRWKDADPTKNVLVDYRMSAHNSILVETWAWPDKNIEALTIYHMDDEILMATHYCPIGNQPKLLFVPTDDDRLTFKLASITNLPDKNTGHNVEFWMQLDSANQFTRQEIYLENEEPDVMLLSLIHI